MLLLLVYLYAAYISLHFLLTDFILRMPSQLSDDLNQVITSYMGICTTILKNLHTYV